jgi:hypothetical protein
MAVANALAYYNTATITAIKGLCNWPLDTRDLYKTFMAVIVAVS